MRATVHTVIILSTAKIYQGGSAGSARMMNLARALADGGASVYACSSKFNKNIDKVTEVEKGILVLGEERDGKSFFLKVLWRFFPFFWNLSYVLLLFSFLKRIAPDASVLLYPQPSVSMDLAALFVFKFLGKNRMYIDANEVRTAELQNFNFSSNPIVRAFHFATYFFSYAKFVLQEHSTRFYDGLIAISTNAKEYYSRFNDNIILVPILTNVKEKTYLVAPDLKNDDTFKIGFTGSIYLKKEGLDIFFKALSSLSRSGTDFELHLYGPVLKSERELVLKKLPAKYGISERIFYHGVVWQESLPAIFREHHLLALPRPLTPQTKYGFSTKLSEYLVSGVPVILTDVSDNCLYITDLVNGFVVPPNDANAMEKKLQYIIQNYRGLADSVAERAFETASRHFLYSNYTSILTDFVINKTSSQKALRESTVRWFRR